MAACCQLLPTLLAISPGALAKTGLCALQIHLRHLVGGRARSYTGALPHEHIFQVDFPERPGALSKFLDVFSPDFLITLFHYRKTGGGL